MKRNELTMITLPKPRFAETNIPVGLSLEEYQDEVIEMQGHAIIDAIDRVSRIIYAESIC